ncbi:aldehyde dehydrogenase family protein, partial [Rhizobium ruizarguesonis]
IAASNSAWGAFLHQGQICMATGLILADEKISEALTAKLVMKASHLPAGYPSTNQLALGPIISDSQVAA